MSIHCFKKENLHCIWDDSNVFELVSGYTDFFDVEAKSFKPAFEKYKTFLNSFGGTYVSSGYYRCNGTVRLMNKKYLVQIHTVSV